MTSSKEHRNTIFRLVLVRLSGRNSKEYASAQKVPKPGVTSRKIGEKTTISQYTLYIGPCMLWARQCGRGGVEIWTIIVHSCSLGAAVRCTTWNSPKQHHLMKHVHLTSNYSQRCTWPRRTDASHCWSNFLCLHCVFPPTESPPRIASKMAAVSNELIHTLFSQIW